jgi:hypothetical protein
MKNNTFAIAVIAALLITTATMTNLTLTNQAFATKSFHETASQSCVNQNARCQDILGQLQGHDNAATLTGNQPTGGAVPVMTNPFANQGLCVAATELALRDNLISSQEQVALKADCMNGDAGQIRVAIALREAGCENFCIPPQPPG